MPDDTKRSVVQRFAAASAKLGNVQKDKVNKTQNYEYASYEAIVTEIRDAFFEQELSLQVEIAECSYTGIISKNDTAGYRTEIKAHYTVIGPDGDSIRHTVYGEGMDYGDKSLRKAATSALKTWLLQAFLISTADDRSDADAVDPPEQAARQKSPPRASQPAQAQGQPRTARPPASRPAPPRDDSAEGRAKERYRDGMGDNEQAKNAGGCLMCCKPFDEYFTPAKLFDGKCWPCNHPDAPPPSEAQFKWSMGALKKAGVAIEELKAWAGVAHANEIPQFNFNMAIYNTAKARSLMAAAAAARAEGEPPPREQPRPTVPKKQQSADLDLDQDDPFNEDEVFAPPPEE